MVLQIVKAIAMIPDDSRERSHGCRDSQSNRDGTAIRECDRDEYRNLRKAIAMIHELKRAIAMMQRFANAITMNSQDAKDDCDDSAGPKRDCDDTASRKSNHDECRDLQEQS